MYVTSSASNRPTSLVSAATIIALIMLLYCVAAYGQDTTLPPQEAETVVVTTTPDTASASTISYVETVLLPQKRTAEARTLLEPLTVATDISADNKASAMYYLGNASLSDGDPNAARVKYLQAATTGVSEKVVVNSLLMAASCLSLKKDYVAAANEYQAIIAQHPTHREGCANARFQIADGYKRQRQVDNALTEFRRVVSEYPETSWVPLAIEFISQLDCSKQDGGQ